MIFSLLKSARVLNVRQHASSSLRREVEAYQNWHHPLWSNVSRQRTFSSSGGHAPSLLHQHAAPGTKQAALSAFRHATRHSYRHRYTDSSGYTHFESGGTNRWGLSTRGQIILGITFAGCGLYYWRSLETVPYTHRRHAILFVSQSQERMLGEQVFEQQCQEAAATGALLPRNHVLTQAVRRVGMNIARVATDGEGGGMSAHMKDMAWDFAVIKSPIPNAFVVPGGKVVVFTALLELLDSEHELAAVLAHETSHVLARHHAERISTMNTWALLQLVVYMLFGIGLPNSAMVLGIFLPYSRLAEYEADSIGLRLMARACYDPAAAPSMLSKLHEKEKAIEGRAGAVMPAFLRTHPLTTARVEKVKKELPEAYDWYKRSGCGVQRGVFRSQLSDLLGVSFTP